LRSFLADEIRDQQNDDEYVNEEYRPCAIAEPHDSAIEQRFSSAAGATSLAARQFHS
jgi:hypothetical protein